ncbi:MAG: endonuclease/exonuclease/phosphatase family protein [Prolixibacteraceae bacterium]
MKKILFYNFIGLNLLAVLALIFSYISVVIPPDKWWLPSLFGLAYPVFLVANIFFILFWLIINPRYIFISLLAIIAGYGYLRNYIQVQSEEIENGDIKVLSFNVMHFAGKGLDLEKETADQIVDFLAEQDADIICLQEVRIRKNSIFNLARTVEDLDFIHHYQYARSSTTFGSVTMTRYPVINMGEIRFENSRNISIYTDVLIENDTVRILNIHLQSYHIDPGRYSIIESTEEGTNIEMQEMREVKSKFKNAYVFRAQQVRKVRKYIDESPYPVILCGDFNDPPASYSYHKLTRGLKDAFVNSGKGVGRTYAGKLPPLRIDYILHSPEFFSYNFQTYDFQVSDHLPISCVLVKQ